MLRADTSWTGLSSADWQTPGNWDNGVPTSVTNTTVDTSAGNMPVINGGTASTASLSVGLSAASDAALTVQGGAALTTTGDMRIGYDTGAQGSILLQGNSTWTASLSSQLSIGYNGTGNLSVLGGSVMSNGGLLILGEASGNGTLLVSGTGSTVTHSAALLVGGEGAGNLTIANGGKVHTAFSADATLALNPGSTGNATVTGAGSEWLTRDLLVGSGGNATLDILEGAQVESRYGNLGGGGGLGNVTVDGAGSQWDLTRILTVGSGSDASLTITDGAVVTAGDGVSIAAYEDVTAEIFVSGAGSTLTAGPSLDIGYGGNGTLIVQNGASATADSVNIGANTNGYGNLTVAGANATFTASQDFNVGYFSEGDATVFNGGGITAQNGANIGYGFEASLSVTGANSTFTVSGGNLNVAYSANATLYVGAGGTVTVNGGALVLSDDDIFANVTLATGGTLQVGGTDGISAWNDNTNYDFNLAGGTLKVVGADLTTDIFMLLGDDTNSIIDTNGFNATLNGEIGGPGGLIKNGAGVLSLVADNCYDGVTVVNAGTLNLPEFTSKIFGDVVVNTAGTLSGNGDVFGNVTLNGTLSPGNSPGLMTTGNMTWNADSTYQFEINDALEGCGCEEHWDTVYIFGDLDLPADLLVDPMTIVLQTLDPDDDSPGMMDNFDPSQGYVWLFAATAAGVVNDFDPAKFTLDTSGFLNAYDGFFSVTSDGYFLEIVYSPVPEPSTYAALAGLAALGAAILRRRRRK